MVPTIWLKESVFSAMLNETGMKLPLETGGIIMGYWGSANEVVITKAIGPGPGARHKRYSFEPDYKYQLEKVTEVYNRSGYTETYLGDWHVHPGASAYLSGTDIQTIHRIANYKKARQPNPIMMILGTAPFGLKAWMCERKKNGWKSKVQIFDTEIQLF